MAHQHVGLPSCLDQHIFEVPAGAVAGVVMADADVLEVANGSIHLGGGGG